MGPFFNGYFFAGGFFAVIIDVTAQLWIKIRTFTERGRI